MRNEDIEFVRDNMLLFTTSRRLTIEEAGRVYDIYNAITGQAKKPTGCSRCVSNTLKVVLKTYNEL
jgi:hypothetical protein